MQLCFRVPVIFEQWLDVSTAQSLTREVYGLRFAIAISALSKYESGIVSSTVNYERQKKKLFAGPPLAE